MGVFSLMESFRSLVGMPLRMPKEPAMGIVGWES